MEVRIKEDKILKQWGYARKSAFTLAEVLITIGVIGVVAAVTLPTLIQNYKKHVVETKLSKFYTTINQAIQMSESVNGDKRYWDYLGYGFGTDEEGKIDYTKSDDTMKWFEKYLKPYLKYTKLDTFNQRNQQGKLMVYFEDGSLLVFSGPGWSYFPEAKNFKRIIDEEGITSFDVSTSGKDSFAFMFAPNDNGGCKKYHYNKGVEPYTCNWDGTTEMLKTHPALGCSKEQSSNSRAYCTKLIQLNGWKIPKDYPLKF